MSVAIARPYAAAAFAYATAQPDANKSMQAWEQALAACAAAVSAVVGDSARRVPDAQLAAAIAEVVELDDAQQRFLAVLVSNGRVPALPFIASRYRALRMQKEGIVAVRVESAAPIPDADRASMDDFLSGWVRAKVQPTYEENTALIGGVRVYVRDDVLDASVLGRLQQMASALKSPASAPARPAYA